MKDNTCSPEILRIFEKLNSAVAKRRAQIKQLDFSLRDFSRLDLKSRRNYSGIQYKLSRLKTKVAESERLIDQLNKICHPTKALAGRNRRR